MLHMIWHQSTVDNSSLPNLQYDIDIMLSAKVHWDFNRPSSASEQVRVKRLVVLLLAALLTVREDDMAGWHGGWHALIGKLLIDSGLHCEKFAFSSLEVSRRGAASAHAAGRSGRHGWPADRGVDRCTRSRYAGVFVTWLSFDRASCWHVWHSMVRVHTDANEVGILFQTVLTKHGNTTCLKCLRGDLVLLITDQVSSNEGEQVVVPTANTDSPQCPIYPTSES